MRLTSDFWVAAFMRDVRRAGGFAYLARRGAEDAGAIFILSHAGGGQAASAGFSTLYGPAPQVFYDETMPRGDRLFMPMARAGAAEITARLEQELGFDPDIWIIEVENFADLSRAAQLRLVMPADKEQAG